jgi:hypothetical protein
MNWCHARAGTGSPDLLRQWRERQPAGQQLHGRDCGERLRAPQELLKIWDVNGALGGPIKRDRLWFFAAARYQGNGKRRPISSTPTSTT